MRGCINIARQIHGPTTVLAVAPRVADLSEIDETHLASTSHQDISRMWIGAWDLRGAGEISRFHQVPHHANQRVVTIKFLS